MAHYLLQYQCRRICTGMASIASHNFRQCMLRCRIHLHPTAVFGRMHMRVPGPQGIRHRRQWDNRLSVLWHRQGKFAGRVHLRAWHWDIAPPAACKHPRCMRRRQCNHIAGCTIRTRSVGRRFRRPCQCPENHGLGTRESMPRSTRPRGSRRLQRDIVCRCTFALRTRARRAHRGSDLGRAAGTLVRRCSMHQTRDTARHRHNFRSTRHIARALRRNSTQGYRLWQCTCHFGNCDTGCSCRSCWKRP